MDNLKKEDEKEKKKCELLQIYHLSDVKQKLGHVSLILSQVCKKLKTTSFHISQREVVQHNYD